jgi:uncharacterized protein YciI
MPLFAVHALDKPDALPLRLEQYDAHRAFIETEAAFGVTVVISGPLQSDDGDKMIGSLFIIDGPDRQAIQKFTEADPFYTAGVWGSVEITRFHRRKG